MYFRVNMMLDRSAVQCKNSSVKSPLEWNSKSESNWYVRSVPSGFLSEIIPQLVHAYAANHQRLQREYCKYGFETWGNA